MPELINYVAYLKSSGTQYIDTEYKANNNTRIVMDIQPEDNGVDDWFFDGRHSVNSNSFGVYCQYAITSKAWYSDYGTSRIQVSGPAPTDRVIIDFNKNVCKIGDYSVTHTEQTFQSSYSTYLLCLNSAGSTKGYVSGKLYSCQIYDNGTLVRDFWPCYDPDGVACLYDKVDKKYYYNAGTGEFTTGSSNVLTSDDFQQTVIFYASGTEESTASGTYAYQYVTPKDLIPVVGGQTVTLTFNLAPGADSGFHWYDSDGNWISGAKAATISGYTMSDTAPSNAAYFRFNVNGSNITPSSITECVIERADAPAVSLISFTISPGQSSEVSTVTYQAESGMTWAEFISSSYNDGSFTLSSSYVLYNTNSVVDTSHANELSTDTIIDGYGYLYMI